MLFNCLNLLAHCNDNCQRLLLKCGGQESLVLFPPTRAPPMSFPWLMRNIRKAPSLLMQSMKFHILRRHSSPISQYTEFSVSSLERAFSDVIQLFFFIQSPVICCNTKFQGFLINYVLSLAKMLIYKLREPWKEQISVIMGAICYPSFICEFQSCECLLILTW